jgi:CRISPR-associated endonuclease/helicase Cas3
MFWKGSCVPVLISFDQCIARPDENSKKYLLRDHLIGVRQKMEHRFEKSEAILVKTLGLAGLCHDFAKCHQDWQSYIRGRKSRGPHHAPVGAFFFSYLAYHLLKNSGYWQYYRKYWLWVIRDIADHHGTLKTIRDNHWISSGEWHRMDIDGISRFIKAQIPELKEVEISPDSLNKWSDEIWDLFDESLEELDLSYKSPEYGKIMSELQLWREMSTALIAGDRIDVAPVIASYFSPEKHQENDFALTAFCQKNSSHPLARIRENAQKRILSWLKESGESRFFTLEMPTGYGKTITALRMASWLGYEHGYQKIIYVAPYISILEQTSGVIEEAMNTIAMEHHSLAILEEHKNLLDTEEHLVQNHINMETWAHSIICTSFQQWMKALFPARAQDLLRRSFLENSVVIIDEPQIFRPETWNVFLCGLEALAQLVNLRVIFLSATMPPFIYGLSQEPIRLSFSTEATRNRYQIKKCEEMDEKSLARLILSGTEIHKCAILNTIADAYLVYREIGKQDDHIDLRLLHGMMVPLHKKIVIEKIKRDLLSVPQEPFCVVSTQVLEAGVDLSFHRLYRALPILPSVIQAAGRTNRHGEEETGFVYLVPFFRNGEKNTRNAIYNKGLQEITDRLLSEQKMWSEHEIMELLKKYYLEMFRNNTYEAGKKDIICAYEGNWPELSKVEPFGDDYYRLPVFIPWIPEEDEKVYQPKKFLILQERIGENDPYKIYEMYCDKEFLGKMTFQEKKEFMILFHHYVINVPLKLAFQLAGKEDYLKRKVPCIFGDDVYHSITGLAQRYVEGFDNII